MRRKGLSKLIVGVVLIAALVAGLVLMGGCRPAAPEEVAPPEEAKVLKMGFASCLTGTGAVWGISLNVGNQIHIDRINAEGGLLVGGTRYKIEPIIEDTRFEVPLSLTVGEKLIYQDKVKFIQTPGMPIGGAMQDIAHENKVIILEWGVPMCLGPEYPYYFSGMPSGAGLASGFFKVIKEREPEIKRIARIGMNVSWEPTFAGGERKALEQLAPWGEWVGVVLYEPGTTDFTPIVTGVLAKNPDAITTSAVGADQGPIIRTLREQGFTGKIIMVESGYGLPELFEMMKGHEEYLEGCYLLLHTWYPPTPEWLEFKEEFLARGVEWHDSNYYYQWGTPILAEALKIAGTVDDADRIAEAIEELKIPNVGFPDVYPMHYCGLETFGIAHHWAYPKAITQIQNGEPVSIGMAYGELP